MAEREADHVVATAQFVSGTDAVDDKFRLAVVHLDLFATGRHLIIHTLPIILPMPEQSPHIKASKSSLLTHQSHAI